jgi:hypothetical protein
MAGWLHNGKVKVSKIERGRKALMNSSDLARNAPPTIPIEEGFDVRDVKNDHIGTVRTFRFSDDDPRTEVAETETTAGVADRERNDIVSNVLEVFVDDDDLPQELRERLLRQGFVRIDQGLFAPDLFATMEQVARVADRTVYLNIARDQLIAK